MQKLIAKYGLAAHLALVAVAPLFLSPSAQINLAVLALVWIVMQPSRIGSEMLHEARVRVASAIVRDPLVWFLLFLVLVSAVRMLNTGIGLVYDAEAGKWILGEAAMPVLPGSVEGAGYPLLALSCGVLVVCAGCRQALGRSARGAMVLVSVFLASCVALYRIVALYDAGPALEAATSCSLQSPAYQGAVYGFFAALSPVSIVVAYERKWLKALPLAEIGICGLSAATFLFAPPVVTTLFAAVLLLVSLYSFVYIRVRLGNLKDFKFLVLLGTPLVFAGMIVLGVSSAGFLETRLMPYSTGVFFTSDFLPLREALSQLSLRVWKLLPWLGSGLGSFATDLQFHTTASDWAVISPLQTAPLNGYWLVLVERGVIGAFLLAVPSVLLVVSYFRGLIQGFRRLPHPLALAGLLLVLAAGAEMMVDCSFLLPEAVLPLVAVFTLSAHAFFKDIRSNG